jgi:uncharacterized protein YecT (DUF1311 family)
MRITKMKLEPKAKRKTVRTFLLMTLVSLAWSSSASAQFMAGGLCQQAASNSETGECFDKAAKEADTRLNRVYAEIQDFLKSQHRTDDADALRKAEQKWIAFRDADCDAAVGLYERGTAGPVNGAACVEVQTRKRIEDLRTGYGWLLEKFGLPF